MDPRIDGNSFGKGTAKTFEDGFKHMMGIAAVRDIDMQGHPALDRKGAKKIWFYNLFWGAKVTVQMRVLSAPTFFSIKK